MASSDIEIKVKVDAQGAVTVFDSLNKKVAEIPATTKKAEESFSSFEKKIITLNQAADLAKRGFDLAKGAFEQLGAALKQGSKIEDISQSFAELARSAGTTSDILIGKLRTATAGTISDFNLLAKANANLRAGLTPDQLVTVAEAARVLGERSGDLKGELEDLTQALVTGQERQLKGKGIFIDTTQAVNKLTAELKAQGRIITETDILQIQRNEILKKFSEIATGVSKVTLDSGDSVEQLEAAFSNLNNKFLQGITSNQDFNRGLSELAKIINQIDLSNLINQFNGLINYLTQADVAMESFAGFLYTTFTPAGAEAAAELERLKKKVGENIDILKTGTLTTKDYTKVVNEEQDAHVKAFEAVKKRNQGTIDYNALAEKSKQKQSALNEELKRATAEFNKYVDAAKKLNSPEGIAGLRDKFEQVYQLWKEGVIPTVPKLNEELQKTSEEALTLGASLDTVGAAAALAKQEIEDAARSAYSFGDALQTGIASGLDSIFAGDFKGGLRNIGSSVLGSIGGEFLGPIGEQLGSQIGDALGKAVFDGLAHVFSGRDAEGKIRDSLDALFADLLKDNPAQIFINGVQQSLSDLDFGRFTDQFNNGTFDDALAGAAANVQDAFNAAGAAFESLVPGAEAVSGQLAAILFNNVGGSLENLQVLIESTGKSFDDLASSIVQSFYAGKISVEEAAQSIIELNDLMSGGIPNAVGAVNVAFNNLQNALAAGGNGGRYLTNAIIAIGKEAQELGLKTIPQLSDALVNKFGFSTQIVAQFLQALAASGITSLDQLVNASANAAIVIGGNLQAIQEGKAPVGAIPTTDSTISQPATSTGGSRASSGGGASQAINQAAQARQQQFNQIEQLISQTSVYQQTISNLNAGLITNAQAMAQLSQVEARATEIVKEHDKLQAQINKRLSEGKAISDEMRLKFEQLNDKIKDFGKSADGSSQILVNSGLLDFVKQFGSDLNLVEIAANAAGISFKTMADAADKAFLSGQKTFAEARDLLTGVGTNNIGNAFKTLTESGTRGGAISLDALKDLGKNTLASGGKTFDDLAAKAINQGVSEDTVRKLLITLKNQGITTLDQLASASTDTGIKVLAGLQDIAFPFKETSNAVLQLLDDISKIPDSKDIDVRLNLQEGSISPAIQALLSALGIDLTKAVPGYGDATDSPGLGTGTRPHKPKRRHKPRHANA